MGWSSQVLILHRAGMTNYQQSWLEQRSHQPSWLGKMGWYSQAISLRGWNLSVNIGALSLLSAATSVAELAGRG